MASIRKIVRKKGIVFCAEVRFPDGTTRSMSFSTKGEAQEWGRSQESLKRSLSSGGVTQVRLTVDEYFEQWFNDYAKVHHSPGWQTDDLRMYRRFLKNSLGYLKLREVQPVHIQKVLGNMLKAGLAASYANRVRQLLSKMFNEAVKTYRYLPLNPVTSVRPFKEIPKTFPRLSKEEAGSLIQWADHQPMGLGIILALQLGLREGEVVGLKWDAVDLGRRQLTVRRKWERKTKTLEEFAKGKKIRELGIYPDALLEKLISQRRSFPDSEFVICNPDGSQVTPMQLTCLLRKGISELGGILRIPFHGLRRSFASLYMENGGDLYDLQKIMGHQSAKTTELYRISDPDYLRKKCDVIKWDGESVFSPYKAEVPRLRLLKNNL